MVLVTVRPCCSALTLCCCCSERSALTLCCCCSAVRLPIFQLVVPATNKLLDVGLSVSQLFTASRPADVNASRPAHASGHTKQS